MRIQSICALAALLLAACAGAGASDDAANSAALSATPQQQISHSLQPGGSSTLSLRTLPNATCTLRPASEAAGARAHLRLFADDEGVARIPLQHLDPTVTSAELALDCAADSGQTFTHSIHVRVDADAVPQAPAPYATAGKPVLQAPQGDPANLSEAELIARGYPPRPSPTGAPDQYAKWLALINSSPTIINPHLHSDLARFHGPARSATANGKGTSNNWSGYVITTPASATQYAEVFGDWKVPRAYAESGFWYLNHSSFWVGMDGWGTPDVVQAGTDQDTETIFGVQASSYGAWTEWYPYSEQDISNFPVNPGDEIYTWVWVGNSSGSWNASGGVGWFLVWNLTQGVMTPYLSTGAPSGTRFNGHQAEWIMERPTVGGSTSSLANYSTAQMLEAWAYDEQGALHGYTSDNSIQIGMYDGSTLLSSVTPAGSLGMQFTWHNYN